jgi:TatD DNase family protein
MTDLIDSHFHLACLGEKGIDASKVLSELKSQGFYGGISICLSENDLKTSHQLTAGYPNIATSFGMGPWELEDPSVTVDSLIQRMLNARKAAQFSFIGEFGLDCHWKEYGPLEKQKLLMQAELELARGLHMPIIIHSREADEETEQMLRHWDNPCSGIIHCFSGDKELAFSLLDRGYFISFAGNITYHHSENICEALEAIPADRILLETDSPYLTPVPHRGEPNDPRRMTDIYRFAAKLRGTTVSKLAESVKRNFTKLLSFCPESGKPQQQ